MQAVTVLINRFSDFSSSQQENPNNLDCLNPKKVWLKGTQPKSPMPRLKSSNGRPLPKSNSTAITYCGTLL